MIEGISTLAGVRVLVYAAQGPLLARERDANDLIGEAGVHDATWVALPAARLHQDFFRLDSGLAGAMLQKFVNYGVRVAVVGEVRASLERSKALRDFAHETNRGTMFWLVDDMAAFERKLQSLSAKAAP